MCVWGGERACSVVECLFQNSHRGHEAELVGARVKASRKEWFIMYGMADLKNCLPKDIVISVRVYNSSRETGQALVKWNIS